SGGKPMPSKAIAALSRIRQLESQHVVFASYIRHLRRRNAAARTLETYADCLSVFYRWLTGHGHASPLQVTPADLDRFMVHLADAHRPGGKPVGVGRRGVYVAVLRSFYRFAVQERHLLSD